MHTTKINPTILKKVYESIVVNIVNGVRLAIIDRLYLLSTYA